MDGYDMSMWKLTLDGYPVKREDLVTFFPPLARIGKEVNTAVLKAEPFGLVGGGTGNVQLEATKGRIREILQAKGLQGVLLDAKLGEVMESCSTEETLEWLPNASWPTLKSLVGGHLP